MAAFFFCLNKNAIRKAVQAIETRIKVEEKSPRVYSPRTTDGFLEGAFEGNFGLLPSGSFSLALIMESIGKEQCLPSLSRIPQTPRAKHIHALP